MDSLPNCSRTLLAFFLLLTRGVLGQMSLNISDVGTFFERLYYQLRGLRVDSDSDLDSIQNASTALAYSTMKWYSGNESGQTPGLLPASGPWSWWEAGALMGQVRKAQTLAGIDLT